MPPSTRPVPSSNAYQSLKRTMSDAESTPHDSKKARRSSSAGPSTSHDSSRDSKRRRKRRKKTPVVSPAAKNEDTHTRANERSRAPLSVRNEIIRISSAPSEADLPVSTRPATRHSQPSLESRSRTRQDSLHTPDDTTEHRSQAMPSVLSDKERAISSVEPLSGPSSSSLEEKVAQLEAELKSKNSLVASHQALLNQIQQAVTCQVCLDLMYKPYALAPCGHLACHTCLVNWFTAPPPDNYPATPTIRRRKTCPHCRAVVRSRPVEVWGVKSIAQATGKSGLLPNQLPVPVEAPEGLNANSDPWKDIFPKPGAASHLRLPWFVSDVDIDDDDVRIANVAPRGEDVGMLDVEDGGIYRCLDCMHEIWDGVCSSCGRVYPGHMPEGGDDDEGDPVGWLEDQMGAEEVDVADDPSWIGLENGEADDGGDFDDWHPSVPLRRRFHVSGDPWGYFGTIHADEEDEDEDDMYGRVDDLRVASEDEGSEDEGYESSFIDDRDEGAGDTDFGGGPRIYEVGDDDEDYRSNQHSRIVDLDSDRDEQERSSDVPGREWARRRHASVVVSSDEEADGLEEDMALSGRGRAPRFIESDGSDIYWSDE